MRPPGVTPELLPGDRARAAILAWFDARGRRLPFRATRDPYAILVSEAMAQQTQAARAAAAWGPFLARFPTVEALAAAAPADVLRAWRGLGYNRRAIHLWRAARAIVEEHSGRVPADPGVLERLPGVGPYTARAVAALAFGRRVGPVDTNVRRVLSRLVGGAEGIGRRDLQRLADEAAPADRPGDWAHALMDLGATVCRPVRPDCGRCPARPWCRFARPDGSTPDDARAGRTAVRPAARRRREAPFASTSRWLRGRILERLRDVDGDGWLAIGAPIGSHDGAAVETALASLAAEGLLERDRREAMTCRLPRA